MYLNFCIHSSVNGHLSGFHVLAIVKRAAMKIGVHKFLSIMIISGYKPSSRIVGSYGNFIPSFLRNLCTVLQASQVVLVVKNQPAITGDMRCGFDPWVRKIPWRRAWQPTPVFLPGESHGQSKTKRVLFRTNVKNKNHGNGTHW